QVPRRHRQMIEQLVDRVARGDAQERTVAVNDAGDLEQVAALLERGQQVHQYFLAFTGDGVIELTETLDGLRAHGRDMWAADDNGGFGQRLLDVARDRGSA